MVTNNYKRYNKQGAATAASATETAPSEGDYVNLCSECARSFRTKSGLQLHRRSAHPEEYHLSCVPQPRVKARWTREDLVLLARAEIDLRAAGIRNINQGLVTRCPGRTLEAIKGVRNKNPRYKVVLAELAAEPDESDSNIEENIGNGTHDEPGAESPEPAGWAEGLREALSKAAYSGDIDLDLISPGSPTQEVKEIIDSEFEAWIGPPKERKRTVRNNGGVTSSLSGARKRKHEYARVQKLYETDTSRCAETVIRGEWDRIDQDPLPMEEMESSWRPIFEKASKDDSRDPKPKGPALWELVEPVTGEELDKALGSMNQGAPGVDGVTIAELKGKPKVELQWHFNLWLYASYQPRRMRMGRTIFIPKAPGTTEPLNHRPITIASVIIRLFHRIIAGRMERTLPYDERQKGFRSGDGVLENIMLLQSIIREHTQNLKPMNIAFVDIKKAFDSVSQKTIMIAARRMGIPEPLLRYIEELYDDSSTVFEVGGSSSEPVMVNQGVKQGDPLSCHLFNCVIDLAMNDLDPEIGVSVFGGVRVNRLAFADDLGLLSGTPAGLQRNLTLLTESLWKSGLEISAGSTGKSASLRIDIDGKKKKWIVNPTPYLRVGEQMVPAVTVSGTYQYLGVGVAAGGIRTWAHETLEKGLSNVTRAPLKPFQRMYFLRNHLVPQLMHQLVLAGVTAKYLSNLDRMMRRAVRGWLKLPKDTPTGYFHASHREGGLSVPELTYRVPLLKGKRLSKLSTSTDSVIVAMQTTASFRRTLRKWTKALTVDGVLVNSNDALHRAQAARLHRSVDGRGLAASGGTGPNQSWVVSHDPGMTGSGYVGAIQLRGNLLHTAARGARGRPEAETACDCCRRYESLGHILQVCPRTWGDRVARHDRVVSLLASGTRRRGSDVIVEPTILTPQGMKRPDLVITRKGATVVCDVTVVADNADLGATHRQKVEYYDKPAVRQWVRDTISPHNSVTFTSVSLNWRGVMGKESYQWLKSAGFGPGFCRLLSIVVLQEGCKMYLTWKRSAYRVGGR